MLELLLRQYIKTLLNPAFARKFGNRIELHIKERTLAGLDKDNKPFKPYSTKPFAVPYASIPKYLAKQLRKQEQMGFFRRNNVLFAVVKSGYAKYKMMRYAKTSYNGTVNLTATGSMLRSFTVLSANSDELRLGFNRRQAAMVYYFNTLRGRDLLGLTSKNLVALFGCKHAL